MGDVLQASEQKKQEPVLNMSQYGDSIAIFRSRMMVRVGINVSAVDHFAETVPEEFSEYEPLAVYMACKSLGYSDSRARSVATNPESFRVEITEAGRFESTAHWGETEIFMVQILARYL